MSRDSFEGWARKSALFGIFYPLPGLLESQNIRYSLRLRLEFFRPLFWSKRESEADRKVEGATSNDDSKH
jgi:hypothetical protein